MIVAIPATFICLMFFGVLWGYLALYRFFPLKLTAPYVFAALASGWILDGLFSGKESLVFVQALVVLAMIPIIVRTRGEIVSRRTRSPEG